ncbi:phage tail protein [Erwinia psidii]|uniref:phage tail sheath C-terminal domain-containing protein n=1 Tax=Erwinia psidii TaxID=69224 RepID=UPI00226B28BF|nr:phage tail sheath C-terminal domain-containing protein [Erwinia psidii]MCX8962136.1 phage tail protein [Erwinia psidii]
MASTDIEFYEIPSGLRKPGKYFEFNTRLAVRTLPGNTQQVVMLAPMLDTGTATPLTAVSVYSDEQAATLFGRGSVGHLMATAAIGANSYLSLQMVGIEDSATATPAATFIEVTGTATAAGTLKIRIGNQQVSVTVSSGDSASDVISSVVTAVKESSDLPVTISVSSGPPGDDDDGEDTDSAKAQLRSRHAGSIGNDIVLSAEVTASGLTVAVATMSGGAGEIDTAPALAAMFAAGHNIIVSPLTTQDALISLRSHLNQTAAPLEQRGALGVGAWTGSLATGTTLTGAINSGRITLAWYPGSAMLPAEIAAAYAAVIASETDPARPLNTLVLSTLDVVAAESRTGRNEQESALHNGLTPLEVGSGESVQIVRAISTYTKNAEGIDDVSMLDITTIRTLDYVRKACRERIVLRFPRDKLSSKTPARVRSELIDVLYRLEDLEIVENVADNLAGLIVERDGQDVNQLNAVIPVDIVNGLHIFAGRIDLIL